ncbi:hypothetical protein VTK26DRAFT_5211 [Humicola hyalothermophila]
MLVKYLLPALVAAGSAAAQSATCTASAGTAKITNQADAGKFSGCRVIKGNVVIDSDAAGTIELSGPREITGDLTVKNASHLETLRSSSIETIGGRFTLERLERILTVDFNSLESARAIDFRSVPILRNVEFGPLTEADEVTISDTSIETLDTIQLSTVKKMDLNNNRNIRVFSSNLGSLSDNLNIQANGIGLDVSLPKLTWIANMTIANVTKFSVPSLKVVNGSARFDSNYFESFTAPNLTHTESGDISFVGNGKLTNLTFPRLTAIGGGLLVANNTELEDLVAFKHLETVGGAIKLRGSFEEIDFSSLDNVRGAFDISSTTDIRSACEKLSELAPGSQGGNGKVEGTFSCTSENERANEDTGGDVSGDGQIDGQDGDDDSGAAGVALNSALFGLVAVAALAMAL